MLALYPCTATTNMCASVQSGFVFRLSCEAFCNHVWTVCLFLCLFVKAYALLLWMQNVVIRHTVTVITVLNSNMTLCQSFASPAAWITPLYFAQATPSCCSRMRAQCRLWSMPASKRTASCTSVCPAPPSKTSRSVGAHTQKFTHLLTLLPFTLLLWLLLDFTSGLF